MQSQAKSQVGSDESLESCGPMDSQTLKSPTAPILFISMTKPRQRPRRGRGKKKKTSTNRKQRGGAIPWVVDVKKGIELIKNPKMWHLPTKAEEKEAKRFVKRIKNEYSQSGTKDSYGSWAVKKGYAKKPDCAIM